MSKRLIVKVVLAAGLPLLSACGNSSNPGSNLFEVNPDVATAPDRRAPESPAVDAPAASCVDGKQDGLETDTDCGGPVCTPCLPGKKCLVNTDCLSGNCSMALCR